MHIFSLKFSMFYSCEKAILGKNLVLPRNARNVTTPYYPISAIVSKWSLMGGKLLKSSEFML